MPTALRARLPPGVPLCHRRGIFRSVPFPVDRSREGDYQASVDVTGDAYLFPYLLTGVRAYLVHGDIAAAENWSDRVAAVLTARAIPGTLPAINHGRGLILLARGEVSAAHQALGAANEGWRARRRFWEGTWARLDLAEAAVSARRRGKAAIFAGRRVRGRIRCAGPACRMRALCSRFGS
jgi:hypothetical protein